MKNKRLVINLISNIISFGLQLGINFILTPIITEKVGDAAYGFIGLANNFVSYATIFTVIINSMASRFVTLELNKENTKKANQYFSSILIMDIVMSLIVGVASTIIIVNLNAFLDIPQNLNFDVKLTFAFAFINLILSIINTVFSIASFAKNRLDLDAIRNIMANIIKAIFLTVVFSIFTPKIYYITIGGVLYSIIVIITNIELTRRLAPELKYSLKNYDKKCVMQLIKSGAWNSINSLGKTLLTGLDLLIANIFVGADAMGILSISKTIPTSIENLLATISNVFSPQFIMLYSKRKIRELINSVNFSIKIIAFIMIVPLSGFITFGTEFFSLWLPTKTIEEIQLIQILSILSLLPYIISACNYSLFLLDTTTNKLKRPVIATLIISILSTIVTLVLLEKTNLGIYAVAGVSSIFWCIKVFFFNTINAAKNLRVKWYTFYPQYLKNLIIFIIVIMSFSILKIFFVVNSWKTLILVAVLFMVVGYTLTFLLLFKKEEKKILKEFVINNVKKCRK